MKSPTTFRFLTALCVESVRRRGVRPVKFVCRIRLVPGEKFIVMSLFIRSVDSSVGDVAAPVTHSALALSPDDVPELLAPHSYRLDGTRQDG